MYDFLTKHSFFFFEEKQGNYWYYVFRDQDKTRATIRIPLNEYGVFSHNFPTCPEPPWFQELCKEAEEKTFKSFRLRKLFK